VLGANGGAKTAERTFFIIDVGQILLHMDGSFGAATERAVKNYQSDHALVVNGIVGDATRRSMLGL
jgi:peptidoglycan hydrolase-like protein with peptidoglycan-binding domain